jgi:hypothetical protein
MPIGKYIRTDKIKESISKSRTGKKKSLKTRKNMSIGKLKFYTTPKGIEARKIKSERFKGRKHTKESREKMSVTRKGKIIPKETRLRMNQDKKGVPLTFEHRDKIRKALTGRKRPPFTEEWRENMRKPKTKKHNV